MFKIVYPEEIMLARIKVLEAEVERQRAELRAVRDILAQTVSLPVPVPPTEGEQS